MDKIKIPRNILIAHDKVPIDFFIKFSLDKRQIPYLAIGVGLCTISIVYLPIGITAKSITSVLAVGSCYICGSIKKEGQYCEELLINLIKYYIMKYKLKKGDKNVLQSIESRFIKSRL